jgi:hypothetical protein
VHPLRLIHLESPILRTLYVMRSWPALLSINEFAPTKFRLKKLFLIFLDVRFEKPDSLNPVGFSNLMLPGKRVLTTR